MGNIDDDLGWARQRRIPEVLEHLLEGWDDLHQQHTDDNDGDGEDCEGIGHRAFDFPAQLYGLLDVGRQTVQDRIEHTSQLASGHQVHEQIIEDFRVLSQRIGKRAARLDRHFDVFEASLEVWVRFLVREEVQRLDDRQARVDHRGELASEDDDLSQTDTGGARHLEHDFFGLLLDLRDRDALSLEASFNVLPSLRLDLSLFDVTVRCSTFPCEDWH